MPTLPSTSGHEVAHRPGGGVVQAQAHRRTGYVGAGRRRALSARAGRWRSRPRPSPRPVRPSPSVVVARHRHRRADAPPTAPPRPRARRGPIFGRLPITCTDDVADLEAGRPHQPGRLGEQRRRRTRPTTRVGRCRRRRRGRRARRRTSSASQAACAATSPSECPASPPARPGQCSPASHSGRPGLERVDVDADADPRAGRQRDRRPRVAAEHGLGEHQVERAGHLERLLGPGTTSDAAARSARPARRRRCAVAVGRGRGVRRRRARPARKPCGVCTARSAVRSTVATTTPSPSTCLTVSATGRPGTTASAPGAHGRDHRRRPARPGTSGAGRVVHQDDVDVASGSAASARRTDSCRVVAARRRPAASAPAWCVGEQGA